MVHSDVTTDSHSQHLRYDATQPKLPSSKHVGEALQGLWLDLKADKRLILLVAIFIWFWTLVYLIVVHHDQYASQAKVMIKDSAINTSYLSSSDYKTTSSSASNPVLNTKELLGSPRISLALYRFFKEKYPEELSRRKINNWQSWEQFYGSGDGFIQNKNVPGTDVIELSFRWSDPAIAQDAMHLVLDTFKETSLDLNKSEQANKSDYLSNNIHDIEDKLEDVRTQKSAYKKLSHLGSVDSEITDLTRAKVDLEVRLNQVQAEANAASQQVRTFENNLGLSAKSAIQGVAIGQNDTMKALQDRLYQLTESYAQKSATMTDEHPEVVKVLSEIEQTKTDIKLELQRTFGRQAAQNVDSASVTVADDTRSNLVERMAERQAEATGLRAESAALKTYLGQVNTKMQTLADAEVQLAKLNHDEQVLEEALQTLNRKQIEANMKTSETLSNVRVIAEPRYPYKPVPLNHKHVLAIGVMLGLVAGITASLLKRKLGHLIVIYQKGTFAPTPA